MQEVTVTVLVVQHKVRDFDSWKPVFDDDESRRREHGAQRHWVYRTVEDPNDVVVAVEFPSADAARSFVQDPGLRDAMERGGVQGEPHVHARDEVEAVEY
jgi:heme-degrading monooxygenase HmoA